MQKEPRSPQVSPTELAKLRRKKNADAQAAFRKRRANYIASLEETVNNLEQIVQNMQANVHVGEDKIRDLQEENTRLRHFVARNGLWEQYRRQASEPISPNTPTVYDPHHMPRSLSSTTPPTVGSTLSSSPASSSGAFSGAPVCPDSSQPYNLLSRPDFPLRGNRFQITPLGHGSDKAPDPHGDASEMTTSDMPAMQTYSGFGAPCPPEPWVQSPIDSRSYPPPPFSMGPPSLNGLDHARSPYTAQRFGGDPMRGHVDESASSSSDARSTPPGVASDPASPFSPPGSVPLMFPTGQPAPHGGMDSGAAFRNYFNHAASIRTGAEPPLNVPPMHVLDADLRDDDMRNRRSSFPSDRTFAGAGGSERHGPTGMYAPLSIVTTDRAGARDDDGNSDATSPELSPRIGNEEYSSTLAVLKNTAFGSVRKTRSRSIKADEGLHELAATRALAGPGVRVGEKRKKHGHDLHDDLYD